MENPSVLQDAPVRSIVHACRTNAAMAGGLNVEVTEGTLELQEITIEALKIPVNWHHDGWGRRQKRL